MASLEDLPADQRAVLQMVVQRGRSYDEIATLLSIDRSAVRQRALDGCDALTPDGIEPGPERALVTDYLLSQLPEQVAEQVYVYLEAAEEDRVWASAIADRLDRLASRPLPEIPVAAPLRSDSPGETLHVPDAEPERELFAAAPPPAPPPPPAPRTPPPARPQRAASSTSDQQQRRALLLRAIGVLAAVVAVAVIVVVANSGSSPSKPGRTHTSTGSGDTTPTQTQTDTNTTTTTTTTTTGPQLLAAVNLTSPVGATKTLGVAQIVRVDGSVGIVIDAQGVPANSAHNAYGLWLYNSPTSEKFVGFDPSLVGKNEQLAIEGRLPANAAHFKHLLITLETAQHPKTPGEVVLSGPFREQ